MPWTLNNFSFGNKPGVTGQNITPAGIYPGLKRPRLDYTRVYYGLGQFIPRGIFWPVTPGRIIPDIYLHVYVYRIPG